MRKHPYVEMALVMALLSVPSGFARAADTNDAWLTTKAKITLLTTDGVSASAVNVDTVNGKVTIHGKVASAAEKGKAEAAVRKLEGVKEVQNLLQVVPKARQAAVDATDDTVKEAVGATLSVHPELENVKVASVNKGVVLLAGKTPTLSDTLKAVEYALAVPGVRRVASEIEAGAN